MNNTDKAARTGATVYLNGTRIDCSHKGRPSVTGAIRVESILSSHAALVEALEAVLDCSEMQKGAGMSMLSIHHDGPALRKARAALALTKGGQP